tara:strand:+ start:257 stop:532 length:276 start_codon:yes stop_codon:yes gene_type:complete
MATKKTKITKAELKSLREAATQLKEIEQQLLSMVGAEQDLAVMKAEAYGKFVSSRKLYTELSQSLEKRYGTVTIDMNTGAISESNDNKGNT